MIIVGSREEDIEQFKAYSQNMGHSSTQTTEKYYSSHSTDDIKRIVTESEIAGLDKVQRKEFEEFLAFKRWQVGIQNSVKSLKK